MKLSTTLGSLTLCAAALAIPATASAAATINSQFIDGIINQLEDLDAERILRADAQGNLVAATGDFQVGDIFQTVFRFTGVNGDVIGDTLFAPYQLTGVAEIKLTSINNCGIVGPGTFCDFTFGAAGRLGDDIVATLYERRVAGEYAFSITGANTPQSTIDGIESTNLIATFGLIDLDDFWIAQSFLSIALASSQVSGSPQQAAGEFGLTLVDNPGLLPIAPNGVQSGTTGTWHDVVGNVSAYQKSQNTNAGWSFETNTTVNFLAVPEPASLALVGAALLGLGATGLRRRRQS